MNVSVNGWWHLRGTSLVYMDVSIDGWDPREHIGFCGPMEAFIKNFGLDEEGDEIGTGSDPSGGGVKVASPVCSQSGLDLSRPCTVPVSTLPKGDSNATRHFQRFSPHGYV